MQIVPGTGWIWSDFSKVNMRFLYWERGPKPTDEQIEENISFIDQHRTKFSLGGTNNLNVDWDMLDWDEYFEKHKGNYKDLQINLNF